MPPQSLSSLTSELQQKQETRERNANETPESDGLDEAIYGLLQPTEETRKRRASETPESDGLDEMINGLSEESEEPADKLAEQLATSPAIQVATPPAEPTAAPRAAKKAKTSAGSKKTADVPAEKPAQEPASTPNPPPSALRRSTRARKVLVPISRTKKAAAKPATAAGNAALPIPQSAPPAQTQAQKSWDEAKFEVYKIPPGCRYIRVTGAEMVLFSTIKNSPSDYPNITIEGKDERGYTTIRRRIVDATTLVAIRKKNSKRKSGSGINDMAEAKRERQQSAIMRARAKMMAGEKKILETWNKAEDNGARLRWEKEEARKEEVAAESKQRAETNAAWTQHQKEFREKKAHEMEGALKKAE